MLGEGGERSGGKEKKRRRRENVWSGDIMIRSLRRWKKLTSSTGSRHFICIVLLILCITGWCIRLLNESDNLSHVSFFENEALWNTQHGCVTDSRDVSPLPFDLESLRYTQQCDTDYRSGMPQGTVWDPSAPTDCKNAAHLSDTLSMAARLTPTIPQTLRRERDGEDDGMLTLPRNCKLRWFNPKLACELLLSLGGVVLVGDSLARHTELALRQVASGNWSLGGYLGGAHPSDGVDRFSTCACDHGYGKFWACHTLPTSSDPTEFKKTCSEWPPDRPPPLVFLPYWGGAWDDSVVRGHLATLQRQNKTSPTPPPTPVLLVEIGPAWAAAFVPGNEVVKKQMQAASSAARDLGATLVCLLVFAPDDAKKPPHVMPMQGTVATREMNAFVSTLCKEGGGVVLDGYALTSGAFSRDGTHYEGKIMTMVAQALLNIAALAAASAQVPPPAAFPAIF